jgi:hypothetical protein
MGTSRHLTGVLLTLFVIAGCRPANVTVSSLDHPPEPPVTPVADVVTLPPPLPVASAVPPPTVGETSIHLAVDLPPGAWQRLQPTFKTQSAVSPQDLPAAAVKALRLMINGQPCPDDQWSVESLQWTAEGGILARLRILQPLADRPCDISLGNATRSFYLRLQSAHPQTATLSVGSTALAFLSVAVGAEVLPQKVPGYIVEAVSRRLLNLMIRSGDSAVTADSSLLILLKELAKAIAAGRTLSLYDVQAIERLAGIGGANGGSGGSGGMAGTVAPPVNTGPLGGPVTIEQTAASTGPLAVGPGQAAAQTFVAPGSGSITGFAVDVASTMTIPTPQQGGDGAAFLPVPLPAMVRLSLVATSGGIPSGSPLATTLALSPPGGGFISGPLPVPVAVTGGQTYAIVVEPQDGASVSVAATSGDPYGDGQAYINDGTWTSAGNRDLRFRVNLAP